MTVLDPYHVTIGGHVIGTYADALESIDGLEGIPGRRLANQQGAYRDGSWPAADTTPLFFGPARQRLRIWVAPFDADGAVTYANGPRAHLRENLETLWRILGGGAAGTQTVGWVVPTAASTKTLQNTARITAPHNPTGSTRLVRRLDVTLDYPFPFWRDTTTGLISVGPTSSPQTFTPGGTAPHVDMTLTCTAAGKVTHDETGDFVEALTGFTTDLAIDLRNGTVLQNGGAADGRAYYNANRPWGLRLPAGVEANLTLTGTWTIGRYNLEH